MGANRDTNSSAAWSSRGEKRENGSDLSTKKKEHQVVRKPKNESRGRKRANQAELRLNRQSVETGIDTNRELLTPEVRRKTETVTHAPSRKRRKKKGGVPPVEEGRRSSNLMKSGAVKNGNLRLPEHSRMPGRKGTFCRLKKAEISEKKVNRPLVSEREGKGRQGNGCTARAAERCSSLHPGRREKKGKRFDAITPIGRHQKKKKRTQDSAIPRELANQSQLGSGVNKSAKER